MHNLGVYGLYVPSPHPKGIAGFPLQSLTRVNRIIT